MATLFRNIKRTMVSLLVVSNMALKEKVIFLIFFWNQVTFFIVFLPNQVYRELLLYERMKMEN